jgi:hypothetical protein
MFFHDSGTGDMLVKAVSAPVLNTGNSLHPIIINNTSLIHPSTATKSQN